jgi:site-specific DNA recombinase
MKTASQHKSNGQTAAIYARVSSKEQEKEGYSIDSQLKLLRDYARKRGLTVVREFIDAETAKQTGRPRFAEMIKYATNGGGAFRIILVEKTDRLYRNFYDYVKLDVDSLDLELHLVKEDAVLTRDSQSHQKLMHGFNVLMAKNQVDKLSEEVRKGMLEKAEQGIYPSHAPIGYSNIDSEGKRIIVPDERTAHLIRKLFEWYATGQYSLLELTRKARAEGLAYRKSGSPMDKSCVHLILRNPIYYGDFRWDGKVFAGTHEALVSRELWDTVQEMLESKARKRTGHRKHNWALQSLVSCGHCGCALVAELKKGKYIYYHCTGHKGDCGEPYVREEVLAEQFGRHLKAIHFTSDVIEWAGQALQEADANTRKYHTQMLGELRTRHRKLQDKLDAMYEDKVEGKITEDLFLRKSKQWTTEEGELRRQIQLHEQGNSGYVNQGIDLLELAGKAHALYERQHPLEKRRLLQLVFSNSTWAGGTLSVRYKKPFDLLAGAVQELQKKAVEGTPNGPLRKWQGRQDSNPRPTVLETAALPTELLPCEAEPAR